MLVFGTVFVAGATVAAVAPLRYGKWVPSSGAIGQIVLLAVFTASVAIYGIEHGVHGLDAGRFAPDATIFIAVAPVLLYTFVGIELPATAGEEMVDPRRDIPVAILRAGIAQVLMYGVPILAMLFVLPRGEISSLHGLIDAMQAVFTVYGAGRRPARLDHGGALHLGAARQRIRVDHGSRPGAGGGLPRRGRPGGARPDQRALPASRS